MAEPSRGGCLQCCCSFTLTLGLSALFLWLSLRTSNPSFSVDQFSAKPSGGATTNVTFLLKLSNPNKDKGIYYDEVNLSLFLVNASLPLVNYTLPRFYQGHKKTAKRTASLETPGRLNFTTPFRLQLQTAVRFKIVAWQTKRHRLVVAGDVAVNATGDMPKSKKGVKLSSGVGPHLDPFLLVFVSLFYFCF